MTNVTLPAKTVPKTELVQHQVVHGKKNIKLLELNYKRNRESTYTEQMEEVYKSFDYEKERDYYWGYPELSVLYGTPLYEQASEFQKIALNHLYWVFHYYATAATENNTILFNQVTASAFFPYEEYGVLCHTLDVETSQERYHINAFHTVGRKTEIEILGEPLFGTQGSVKFSNLDRDHQIHKGLAGRAVPKWLMNLYTVQLNTSPFLSSQYYTARGIGNLHLKNKEKTFSQYYKELEKKEDYIPAPTNIARLHMLDEAFHTATSQLLSHDLYKDFPEPSVYERFLANRLLVMLQRNVLKGMSGVIPGAFAGDGSFIMPLVYRLLRSRLFDMSQQEALAMMEKCFCQEHDGFQTAHRYHQSLLNDLRKFLDGLDYLWPVNREMKLMESVGTIEGTLNLNMNDFRRFKAKVAA